MRFSRRCRSAAGGFLGLLILYLLIFAGIARGQSESLSGPPSLEANLTSLVNLSQTLVSRLTERQQEVTALKASLEALRQSATASGESLRVLEAQLTQAEASLQALQTELSATSTLLEASETSLSQVGTSFAAYREEMRRQVQGLQRERDLWRWIAAGAGAVAVVLAIVAAVK